MTDRKLRRADFYDFTIHIDYDNQPYYESRANYLASHYGRLAKYWEKMDRRDDRRVYINICDMLWEMYEDMAKAYKGKDIDSTLKAVINRGTDEQYKMLDDIADKFFKMYENGTIEEL